MAELYRGGMTTKAIAKAEQLGVQTVRADLNALGFDLGKGGAPRKHPVPSPRRCALGSDCRHAVNGMGCKFTPPAWNVLRGGGKFCSPECKHAAQRTLVRPEPRVCRRPACGVVFSPDPFWASLGMAAYHSRKCRALALKEENEARASRAAELITIEGKLTLTEAAAYLRLESGTVRNLVSDKKIAADRIAIDGRAFLAFTLDALKTYEGTVARNLTPEARSWLHAPTALPRLHALGRIRRLAERLGIPEDQAEDIERGRIERRRKQVMPRAAGRPRKVTAKAHHLRWLTMFDEQRALEYAIAAEREDELPSDFAIARDVAGRDWRESPHDWPRDRYPQSRTDADMLDPAFERAAADRVLKAIKPLLRPQRKITAG